MSITLDKVLARLESELERAMDTGNVQKKREHLAAMKSLCELALETDADVADRVSASEAVHAPTSRTPHYPQASYQQTAPNYTPPTQAPPIANVPSKPIKEDDANGDSLFDF
ncbi:hypothetical protein AB685_09320 [Bacillus sp. LL01]|nr:hypothetical protein AB685_09320 [Bacillus sp. LL01]